MLALCGCRNGPTDSVQLSCFSLSAQLRLDQTCTAAGANLAVAVPWKYLNLFMEDDEKLADVGQRYAKGTRGDSSKR